MDSCLFCSFCSFCSFCLFVCLNTKFKKSKEEMIYLKPQTLPFRERGQGEIESSHMLPFVPHTVVRPSQFLVHGLEVTPRLFDLNCLRVG